MRRLLLALAAACLLATILPAGATALSWSFASQNAVGDQPRGIVVGEYGPEDVGQDFIVANSANNEIEWKLSNGDGTFHDQDACTGPTFPVGGGPAVIAKGSWTGQTAGDGLLAAGFADPVVTALNHGGIGGCGFVEPFPSAQPLLALGLSGLAVGDLNGDGNDDSVVSDFSTDLLLVSLQNAEAEFGLFNGFVGGDGPRGPTLADFNRDGKLDVAVADGVTETAAVALGNGNGTFPAPSPAPGVLEAPLAVAAIEADGDGALDLLVAELGGVSLLRGNGNGTFVAPVRVSEGSGLVNVSVGDVNGDGRDDVLIAYQGTAGSVAALLSRGDGTFAALTVSDAHIGEPMAAAVADFRGDGSRDLAVVSNGDPGAVTVLLGVPQVVAPGAVAFGGQRVGTTSAARTITIDNPGAGTLHVSQVELSGADPGQFEIAAQSCTAGVKPGQSCEVKVVFDPASSGEKTAELVLADDAPGNPHSVDLSGIGEVSTVDFNPASLTFGGQNVGTASAGRTIVLRNSGGADLDVSTVALTGADASQFQLDHQTCTEHPIPPEGSCQVVAEFRPASSGEKHAAVTLTDDAPSPGSTQSAALSGTGTEAGLAVSPGALEFGGQDVGVGVTRSLLVTNSGDGPLEVQGAALGGANPQDFVVAGDGCAAGAVPPAGACTLSVEFAPTADGARSGSLRIESNAGGGAAHVPLQGRGLERTVAVSPGALEFGAERLGGGGPSQTVTVANVADGAVRIGGVTISGPQAGDFGIASQGCTGAPLAAGRSCEIVVGYAPGAAGASQARLEIGDDAGGGPHAVPLSGSGVESGTALSRRTLGFGSKPVGRSGSKRLSVRNTGTAPLNVRAARLGGSGRRSFRPALGSCAAPVQPGGSCALVVTFRPRAPGALRARLSLVDDAPGSAFAKLRGWGIGPHR